MVRHCHYWKFKELFEQASFMNDAGVADPALRIYRVTFLGLFQPSRSGRLILGDWLWQKSEESPCSHL